MIDLQNLNKCHIDEILWNLFQLRFHITTYTIFDIKHPFDRDKGDRPTSWKPPPKRTHQVTEIIKLLIYRNPRDYCAPGAVVEPIIKKNSNNADLKCAFFSMRFNMEIIDFKKQSILRRGWDTHNGGPGPKTTQLLGTYLLFTDGRCVKSLNAAAVDHTGKF